MRSDGAQWKTVGLTNTAGEGVKGSSRIDRAGNLSSSCSCSTPWLSYFVFMRQEMGGAGALQGQSVVVGWKRLCPNTESCPAPAELAEPPTDGNTLSLSPWQDRMARQVQDQGKPPLPEVSQYTENRKYRFSRLAELRSTAPKIFLHHPNTQHWSTQNLCQTTLWLDGCINPIVGPVTTHNLTAKVTQVSLLHPEINLTKLGLGLVLRSCTFLKYEEDYSLNWECSGSNMQYYQYTRYMYAFFLLARTCLEREAQGRPYSSLQLPERRLWWGEGLPFLPHN